MPLSRKARYFWPFALVLFLSDCTSKSLIVDAFGTESAPHPVLDSFLRFTLRYNPDMAYSFDVHRWFGANARWVLVAMMLSLVVVFFRMYRNANLQSRVAGIAFGLACGGALGNLFDRLRFPAGVVDFIDVGIGTHRFYIFNVADAGITIGAILFAIMMWRTQEAAIAPSVGEC